MIIDLRPFGLTCADASDALEQARLTANKNAVPGDTQPPQVTSGLRFGTSAGTARGLRTGDFRAIGGWIADILHAMTAGAPESVQARVSNDVSRLVEQYPIYPRSF